MFTKKAIMTVLITLTSLLSITFIYGQDSPYEQCFQESMVTDLTWGRYQIIDIHINSDNRCFFTLEMTWGHYLMGGSNKALRVYQFGTDNVLTYQPQTTYSSDEYPSSIYRRSVLHGLNNLAFPVLSDNLFKWSYSSGEYSNTIQLPGNSYEIAGISQIDDTHCLILFRDLNNAGYQVLAYYMDTNANIIWNCTFNLDNIATVYSTFQKVILVDDSHFAIGMQRTDQFYEIYKLNSTGAVETSSIIQTGAGAYLSTTNIPGRFIVTASQGDSIACYKYENNISTYIMKVPASNPPRFVPVVADSNCIVVPCNPSTNSMKIIKYAWNGSMIWTDDFNVTPRNTDSIVTRWLKLASNGSILTALFTKKWGIIGYGLYQPIYGWTEFTRVMKIMPDGETTELQDEVLPLPSNNISIYPNPFHQTLSIDINLDKSNKVECNIYDIKGRKIRTLSSEGKYTSTNSLVWDGRDSYGKPAAPGMYIIRIKTEQSLVTRKALKLR
jgi:hypothetical protein